jgi:hypothetical protein
MNKKVVKYVKTSPLSTEDNWHKSKMVYVKSISSNNYCNFIDYESPLHEVNKEDAVKMNVSTANMYVDINEDLIIVEEK